MHYFEVNIRICEPENSDIHRGKTLANITFWWLTYPDGNLKKYTNSFVIWHCLSFLSFIKSISILINLLKSDVSIVYWKHVYSNNYFLNFVKKCNLKITVFIKWTKSEFDLWQKQIMSGNLRFITIFDNFLLPNQVDLSAYCFYHFSTSNVLILRCNNTLIFPRRFQY